eukprot:COSAG05_NODE_1534_length_4616_cov_6.656409_8_plen_47_part_00
MVVLGAGVGVTQAMHDWGGLLLRLGARTKSCAICGAMHGAQCINTD